VSGLVTYQDSIARRLTGEPQQLVEVGASLFSERGHRSTSMNDIAEAAGVTKPLLYQHFCSNKELYLELVNDVTYKAESPRQKVELSLNAYFILVVSDKACAYRGWTRQTALTSPVREIQG
jgi:AcrR family transcriptional regulator